MRVAGYQSGGKIRGFMPRLSCPTLVVSALLLIMNPPALAGQESEESGSLVSLRLPVGARVVGQGSAVVAVRSELQGLPYNPASLQGFEKGALTYSRFQGASEADFNTNYIAGGYTTKYGVVGGQFIYFDLGSVPITDTNPDPIGSIDLSDWTVGFSYANRWRDKLAYGGTFKWYSSNLGVVDASGPAFDFGLIYQPRDQVPVEFGLSFRNLGPDVTFERSSVVAPTNDEAAKVRLPSRLRVGVSGTPEIMPDYSLLLVFDVDMDFRQLSDSSLHFGGGFGIKEILFLRGGLVVADNPFVDSGDGSRNTGGSFGIGVRYEGFEADIAREISMSDLGDETHFAVGWRF